MTHQVYKGVDIEVDPHCLGNTFVAIFYHLPALPGHGDLTVRVEPGYAVPLAVGALPPEAADALTTLKAVVLPWDEANLVDGKIVTYPDGSLELPFEVGHYTANGELVPVDEYEKDRAISALLSS